MELVKQQTTSKKRLKLGDIAEHLQIKKFVIRTWEKELGLSSPSGYYSNREIDLFKKIKQLVLVEQVPLQQAILSITTSNQAASVNDNLGQDIVLAASTTDELTIQEESTFAPVLAEALSTQEEILETSAVVETLNECSSHNETATQDETKIEEHSFTQTEQEIDGNICLEAAETTLATDNTMISPAELCQSSTQPVLINHNSQQQFIDQLAFFKEKLLKFHTLLKN